MKKIISKIIVISVFFISFISLVSGAEAKSTIQITGLDVTGTEILVTTTTKFEDVVGVEKKREIVVLLFNDKVPSDSIGQKSVLNRSEVSGIGTILFDSSYGLKPETNYKIRAYIKETTIKTLTTNTDELIYNPESFVNIKTGTVNQKDFNSVDTNNIVNFDPSKLGVAENKTKYTLLAPIPGFAKCIDTGENPDKDCTQSGIGDYLGIIFKFGIGLCAALAVVYLIIYGFIYMGDESVFGKTEAKHKMLGAIGGLIIAIGAYALLNTINPDLTGKNGFTINSANIELHPTSGGGYFGVDLTKGDANVTKNIHEYDVFLQKASKETGVQCTLIKAFMYAESGGINGQTSPAKAKGLMQLIDGTFQEQGYDLLKIMDPETNIMAGAKYISKLQKNGCGTTPSSICDISNIQFLAASYNGGPGANKESSKCSKMTIWQCPQTVCNNGTDCFAETRKYAPRVEANYNKLKSSGWGC